jgi:hypothetical protein
MERSYLSVCLHVYLSNHLTNVKYFRMMSNFVKLFTIIISLYRTVLALSLCVCVIICNVLKEKEKIVKKDESYYFIN